MKENLREGHCLKLKLSKRKKLEKGTLVKCKNWPKEKLGKLKKRPKSTLVEAKLGRNYNWPKIEYGLILLQETILGQ